MSVPAARTVNPTGTQFEGSPAMPGRWWSPVEHTHLDVARVPDPALRELITGWDAEFTSTPETQIEPPLSGDLDAVAAVASVCRSLQVPEADVLAAAGIKERTYYEWKANHRRPRMASLGKLWAVVQMAEGLTASHADTTAWFRWHAEHREMLRQGRTDELMSLFVHDRLGRSDVALRPGVAADTVGQEVVLDPEPSGSLPLRRSATPRRIAP